MLTSPSVSFPFRHVTIVSRTLIAITEKPIARGIDGLVVDPEGRHADEQQGAEQQPDHACLDRTAALLGPVHVAKVEGERELIEDERATDPEDHREDRPARVARRQRDVDHPGCEHDHDADDHVVDVDASELPAPPVVAARKARVDADADERRERCPEQEQQGVATGKPVAVDLNRVAEVVPDGAGGASASAAGGCASGIAR